MQKMRRSDLIRELIKRDYSYKNGKDGQFIPRRV